MAEKVAQRAEPLLALEAFPQVATQRGLREEEANAVALLVALGRVAILV